MVLGLLCAACDDADPPSNATDGLPPDGSTLDRAVQGDAAPDGSVADAALPADAGGSGGGGAGGEGGAGGAGGGGGMVPPGMLLPPEDECIAAVVRIGNLDVFAHEASRPDATGDAQGEGADRACSRAGVLPWTNLTVVEAEAACTAAGFSLCSDREWQDACGGVQRQWVFPYGPQHQPGACNDHVSGTAELQPTGSQPNCVTPDGLFDMSGNVWEMTADRSRRGASYRINAVMFRTENARCDVPYTIADSFYGLDLGFRCCRAAP